MTLRVQGYHIIFAEQNNFLMHAKHRVQSVDLLRGLVIIIMALDHVREFWGVTPFRPEDLNQAGSGLFLTRWITHFCAPVFAMLSGVSIFFLSQRKTPTELSSYLIKRGLWLVMLQVCLLSFFMQFSYNMIILEIIWVLGWSMIFMAVLVRLPVWLMGTLALLVIAGHNLVPDTQTVEAGNVIKVLLLNSPTVVQLPGFPVIVIAYTILPGTAIMAIGFVTGRWFSKPAPERNSLFARTGLTVVLLFVVLRYLNGYGDPNAWTVHNKGTWFTVLSFLNVSKYPPSLLFILMTLGVSFLLMPLLERLGGKFGTVVRTFGEVPFFFFILHIPLIVAGAHIWMYVRSGVWINLAFASPDQWPAAYEPNLLRTYMVWLGYMVLLYFPCRWFAKYKHNHRHWWLSYF